MTPVTRIGQHGGLGIPCSFQRDTILCSKATTEACEDLRPLQDKMNWHIVQCPQSRYGACGGTRGQARGSQ